MSNKYVHDYPELGIKTNRHVPRTYTLKVCEKFTIPLPLWFRRGKAWWKEFGTV